MGTREIYDAAFFAHIKTSDSDPQLTGDGEGFRGHRLKNPARNDDDGVFVEWKWDGTTFNVFNDRYGFFPVYYFATEKEFIVSNSIERILAAGAPRDLDDGAIAAFLRLGYFLGDDTPFAAVKMLGPSGRIFWSLGGTMVTASLPISAKCSVSRSDATGAYRDLFRASIERRGAPVRPLLVPLSGGRDSRHIVLELSRQHLLPDACLTAVYPATYFFKNEVEIAKNLCSALRISHETLNCRPHRMNTEREKNSLTNFATFEHGWFMPVADRIRQGAAVTYDGMAGDVLSAGHFLSENRLRWFREGNFRALFMDMQVALNESSLNALLTASAVRRFNLDVALEKFEIECLRHAAAPNPVGSFSIFNRTRRVASLCAYALQPTSQYAYSPFLDNELFDFLSSLPAETFLNHSFHSDTILAAYPEYAELPYSITTEGSRYFSTHRAYALELLGATLRSGPSTIFRKSFTVPRLLRCLVDRAYSPAAVWLGDVCTYFMQIEEFHNRFSRDM